MIKNILMHLITVIFLIILGASVIITLIFFYYTLFLIFLILNIVFTIVYIVCVSRYVNNVRNNWENKGSFIKSLTYFIKNE